jgi:hypothetical protein
VSLYNNAGLPVQKWRKKDFQVQSAYDGMSLATDDKTMQLTVSAPGYPCTIEKRYTISTSGYIDLPNAYINNHSNTVETFRYVVKAPELLDIRYQVYNTDLKPSITTTAGIKVYTWEARNMGVQKIEADSYNSYTFLPQIKVSPNSFEYDGYKGSFKSWNEFGKWNYALYEDKKPFSNQRVAEINSLTSGTTDVAGKVAALYDYLKKNMRYVSIQFGIGGFKPLAVRFVDEKKYGDCKALTNYMRYMLAVAGIRSYPALINAQYNNKPVDPEFPETVFNHVILCVPNGRDSIWLECTSNSSPAGFLGSSTENKNALLLTETGGFLVKTPKSDFSKSTFAAATDIYIDEEGSAKATIKLSGSGSFNTYLDDASNVEESRQNQYLVEYLGYKQPDAFQLLHTNSKSGYFTGTLHTEYEKFAAFKAGAKLFFPLGTHTLCTEKLEITANRKTAYLFHFPYTKLDTAVFHLPAGASVHTLPKEKTLDNEWLHYSRQIRHDAPAGTVTVIRKLVLKTYLVLPVAYKTVAEGFQEISQLENDKLIIEKGEQATIRPI